MKKNLRYLLLLACSGWYHAPAQLHVQAGIPLPKDSAQRQSLLHGLEAFLQAADADNAANTWVWPAERIETFVQLDELKGIRNHKGYGDTAFYKPCLMNAVLLKDSSYWLQISYMGVHRDSAMVRASFDCIAHPFQHSFRFSSPLRYLSRHWKVQRLGNYTIHYKDSLNQKQAQAFRRYADAYDARLGNKEKQTDLYCTADAIALQRLAGVTYKADYAGLRAAIWSANDGPRKLMLLGNDNETFSRFDPHDLWHDRLSLAIERSKTNRAVDEGCAYLYGGSWGMSWLQILDTFKARMVTDSTDWAALKEKPVFFKTGAYSNNADYIVNALWVKRIEQEKGFAGVWQLLLSGPARPGNNAYYETLERLTGIDRAHYNESVRAMIRREQP